jgi:A/G-specific adenine glycosylase
MAELMNKAPIIEFQQTVQKYFTDYGRHDMLWRQPDASGSFDAYKIMISEIMLQQTQVARVTIKYQDFLKLFPSVNMLASALLADVLSAWSGLGYNRRAKFLWQAAKMIVNEFGGVFPQTLKELMRLPGIGPNTAGAILAYAFNQPVVFIETNIRTVYIHHFFADETNIPDKQVLELVKQTLDIKNPRQWYWALMDYGAHLKQTVGNVSRSSKSYAKQAPFKGSLREVRGNILRVLMEKPHTNAELVQQIGDDRITVVLASLVAEELISLRGTDYHLG